MAIRRIGSSKYIKLRPLFFNLGGQKHRITMWIVLLKFGAYFLHENVVAWGCAKVTITIVQRDDEQPVELSSDVTNR